MSRFLDKKLVFLKPYIPGEQPKGIKKLIKLNTNESPFPPCPGVKKAAGRASKMLNLYSDPACTNAVNAIADFYGLNSKNVFLSNGSDETLAFIFHGFCPKGAAFADITYGFYKVFADMFGIKTRIVPLDNDFNIKVEDYKNLDQTIFIANPNAPTGILLPVCMIEELLLQSPDRLVVVDEAYIDFGGESAVRLIEKYDNIIVVQTFSKSRSLAGARLGFAIANDDLISDLNRMKFSFNPYNVNTISLLAAEEAMKDRQYFEKYRKEIIDNREYLSSELRRIGFKVLDSKANFVFAGRHGSISAKDYYDALRQNNILVRYFDSERIKDFVRITIGTSEQMRLFVETTEIILKGR